MVKPVQTNPETVEAFGVKINGICLREQTQSNTITSRVGLSADHRTVRQVVAVAAEISQQGGDVRSNAAPVDREQWPV